MARRVYNFIWTLPVPDPEFQGMAAQRVGNTVASMFITVPGVILYPSLLTPMVYVLGHETEKPDWLELVIATGGALTEDMINRQLKLSIGLDSHKSFNTLSLFPAGAHGNIECDAIGDVADDGKTIIGGAKFNGILHPAAARAFKQSGITKLYRVRIKRIAIPDGPPAFSASEATMQRRFTKYRLNGLKLVPQTFPSVVGGELSDQLIRDMLNRRISPTGNVSEKPMVGQGRYAFRVSGSGVNLTEADPEQPIQSYHPLFVLDGGDDAKDYLNIGHLSDVHVNSRWQLLAKSTARVIEYAPGPYSNDSPEIGKLVAQTNSSFHEVLDLVCKRSSVVVIGGDLIDHIRNAYDAKLALTDKAAPPQVWDAMNIFDGHYNKKTYPEGVDLVAFYSLVLDAIKRHTRPCFGISGNHDCYYDAFGISPRLAWSRTNDGIPADLNLTFYEAMLAFGPSGGLLTKTGSSFSSDWYEWFYLVLSPFQDWWAKFPKQSLVGLGWGDGEQIIMPTGGQDMGHLPLSDDGISGAQLALVQQSVGERGSRKVILTTHFTFLSYSDDIPMFTDGGTAAAGKFAAKEFGNHALGTFRKNRSAVLDMLAKRQIQCVLTGHSHRRGLYLLGERSSDLIVGGMAPVFDEIIPAAMYDTDRNNSLNKCRLLGRADAEPAIVVSDSGGPYPRHNRNGEFNGYGSDRPGGTLISFDQPSGKIDHVYALTATSRPKPRGAPALDYADVVLDTGVFVGNTLMTNEIPTSVDSGAVVPSSAVVYTVEAKLTKVMHHWGLSVEQLVFAGKAGVKEPWIRVAANPSGTPGVWEIPNESTSDFRLWLRGVPGPSRFVSIKMQAHHSFLIDRYNWEDHWNFEVEVEPDYNFLGTKVSYKITRPQRALPRLSDVEPSADPPFITFDWLWRELPNFQWRKANDVKYGA